MIHLSGPIDFAGAYNWDRFYFPSSLKAPTMISVTLIPTQESWIAAGIKVPWQARGEMKRRSVVCGHTMSSVTLRDP